MTNIEMDVARSTINKNKALVRSLETINWEQRRYEIAKELLPNAAIAVNAEQNEWMNGMTYPKASAILAIRYADALIEELRRKPNEKE